MNPIQLIMLAINGLRTVLGNPALGGGSSVRLTEASELLGILGMLIEQGDDGLEDLKEFTEVIEDMASKGRAPSQIEWDIMRRRSDDAHARLQKAKEELLADEAEETVDDEVPADPVEPEFEQPIFTSEADPADVEQPTPAEDTLPDDDDIIVDPNAG